MNNQIETWSEKNAFLVERGIDEPMWGALCNTIYPGAKPESIVMAVDYCRARKLDIMLKPVHLVPMNVKDSSTGEYSFRDVPMPGVGLYRIQASRSGDFAGMSEPKFGPVIELNLSGEVIRVPESCSITVTKLIGDRLVNFTATEFWEENYATAGKGTKKPNSMWCKRPRGQLAKCAEAQALRKGWPEIGQEATAEEMAGKDFEFNGRDVNPPPTKTVNEETGEIILPEYSEDSFNKNEPLWKNLLQKAKCSHEDIINKVSASNKLSEEQIKKIKSIPVGEVA